MKLFDNTQYSSLKSFLSFDTLWFLSILGGIFALDHLYLRSPLSGILKIFLNVITFGTWWLFDASQVLFNADSVKLFGLGGQPLFGPGGLGAGVLAGDKPSENHMSFFWYAVATIFGGAFGADAFLVGKRSEGIIRLILFFSIIFTAIALLIYIVKVVMLIFAPQSIMEDNWEYFGLQRPLTKASSMISKIPLLGPLYSFFDRFSEEGLISGPLKEVVQTVIEPLSEPLAAAAESGIALGNRTLNVAELGISTAKAAVNTAGEVVSEVASAVGPVTTLLGTAIDTERSASPGGILARGLQSQGLQTQGLQTQGLQTQGLQSGGSSSDSTLSYTFMGSIAFIIVSGLVISYRRFRQNKNDKQSGSKGKNDTPPEPGSNGAVGGQEPSKTT